MNALGEFLTQLPMPLGPIVTGLLPFMAIGGLAMAAWGNRMSRRGVVAAGAVLAVLSLISMAAFLEATSSRS